MTSFSPWRSLDAAALRFPVLANLGLLHTLEFVAGGSTTALAIALQNFLMLAHALSTQPRAVRGWNSEKYWKRGSSLAQRAMKGRYSARRGAGALATGEYGY